MNGGSDKIGIKRTKCESRLNFPVRTRLYTIVLRRGQKIYFLLQHSLALMRPEVAEQPVRPKLRIQLYSFIQCPP